jgi:subtilisin family serine protease
VDPALWELLRAEAGTDGDRVLEAIIRLARPGIEIPGVRIVSRFGTVATCRLRARDVITVRARSDVISLKAARGLSPGFESATWLDAAGPAGASKRTTDVRRSPGLALTGAGVVVAAIDWGVDVDSAAFRWPDDLAAIRGDHEAGATRFLSFWDQRDQAAGPRPEPYGYGSVHGRTEIDRALQHPRPYERLGYHPAIADPRGRGSHGTRTMDIAAGNGEAGGPVGIAPEADLIFVHLADRNTGGLANFGDSVRLLEAVDFISRTAGQKPCVINISAGRLCGPRDGTTLVERAFDELLANMPGRFIVDSAGNYFHWRAHSCGSIRPGEARSLTVVIDPADVTPNEIEIWYDGADEFAVRIDPPGYAGGPIVCLGQRSDLIVGGQVAGRVYHRRHDPNNGDNHIVAYMDPVARPGEWTVTLEARRVSNGRFHAWIERDDSCPGCQARFTLGDSNPATTIGSIASSHLPLIVGAYNGHDPARPVAAFSSAGPCRDGRSKPDLVAPGVDVLAARSAPVGASHGNGLLVRGNGTSFATPHVTGAVALCLEAAGNRLSAKNIRSLLLGSCDPVSDADPDCRLGHGYLNIPRLVADVQRAVAAPVIAPSAKESTMATEDTIVVLAAAPAMAYREYLYRPRSQLARWVSDRFELVTGPGQRIDRALREGDVLIEVALGRIGPGRCVKLAARDLELIASRRQLAPGQLLLRPKRRAEMTEPLPVEPSVYGLPGWYGAAAGPAPPVSSAASTVDDLLAEQAYEEDDLTGRRPVPVDAAAAVPPFDPAERATVVEPLLSAQASARASAWNDRMHPCSSGVTLDEVRNALRSYVDATAVQAAIDRHNKLDPSRSIDASTPVTDAVFAECVHQFQKKCYCEKLEHDGQAGESTLDSLGLIRRYGAGFHGGLRHNAKAQERLTQHDKQVQAVTSQEFSASSWFSGITDPSVFGMRTKGHNGLHVLLVRRLRQAERYLLTLPAFRGKPPAALGAALGLTERHAGMRSATTGSMHTFGLAIDIEYTANPWLRRPASWQAMRHAAALVSGISLGHESAPGYLSSLGSGPARSTGQIWDQLHQRHTELVAYFKLGQDAAALHAALLRGQSKGTAGLVGTGESVDQAVTRWQTQIQHERKTLAANDADFTNRDPGQGFLAHRRDLVIALRDHGCLAWGAVDQGASARGSGDMMHFDARIDGVGRVLAQGVNYVPGAGHHPCRSASSPSAESSASSAEADGSSASDYLGGKLWTFTATTLPLPVAVFCPKAAMSCGEVEILVYAHGLLNPCRHRQEHIPAEFVTDPPFAFGHIVNGSGRPMVLVIPLLNWARPGGEGEFGKGRERWHALAAPQHLSSLIREVLTEIGRVQATTAPSVRDLIIAGHSRAYDFLEPLVHHRRDQVMHEGALARLSQVWAFDTTYVGEVDQWIDWLALNPRLRVHVFYLPGSKTARVGREFYCQRGPRLAVTRVGEKHCYIPATRLPALLNPRVYAPGQGSEGEAEAFDDAQAVLDFKNIEAGDVQPDLSELPEFEDAEAVPDSEALDFDSEPSAREAGAWESAAWRELGAPRESEDNPPARDRFVVVSNAVRALSTRSGTDVPGVLTGLRSLGPVEMCRLGEDPALVGALADHLAAAELAEAGAQLARGRLTSMGRADLARIIASPSVQSLGVLAGAYGHEVLLAHHDAYDRTGTGTIHGNRSGAPKPTGAVSTDCTAYVLTMLDQAFAAKGLAAEWQAVRSTAITNSKPGGLKGTEVIKALQADRNWQAVFWAPDPTDPADANSEHPFAYRKVRSGNTYYGINVDPARSVIDYRRTRASHRVDLTGIGRLQRLQFGLLAARGGIHMAMIVNGEVHEVHWSTPATSRDSITATPLETFAWQSGVIAAPPGDLDLAWRMP